MINNKTINLTFLILVSLFTSLQAEGKILGVFRAIDLILVFFLIMNLGKLKIQKNDYNYLLAILFIALLGTVIGLTNSNPFVLSDLKNYVLMIISILIIPYLVENMSISSIVKFFYISMILTIFIYILIEYTGLLYEFYGNLNVENKIDFENRLYGPNVILILYSFIFLSVIKPSVKYSLIFLLFSVILYLFNGTRHILVINLFSIAFSFFILYKLNIKTFIYLSVVLLFFVLVGLNFLGERFIYIFNPFQDSSFLYRVISNAEFIYDFTNKDIFNIFFGEGLGSVTKMYLGGYIGFRYLNILDNSILTLLLKGGVISLSVFILIYYKKICKFSLVKKVLLLFPIVLVGMLTAHIFTIIQYFFSFWLVSSLIIKYSNKL